MQYKISVTYTPDETTSDRSRQKSVFSPQAILRTLREAAMLGLQELKFSEQFVDDAMVEYDELGHDETNDDCRWSYMSNNGEYEITIEKWEPDDPVGRQCLKEWAIEQANAENEKHPDREEKSDQEIILVLVLSRQCWARLEWTSVFDAKQELHDLLVEGDSFKSYNRMTMEELVTAVMEEVVAGQRDNWDDETEPFGFKAMVKAESKIWLDK